MLMVFLLKDQIKVLADAARDAYTAFPLIAKNKEGFESGPSGFNVPGTGKIEARLESAFNRVDTTSAILSEIQNIENGTVDVPEKDAASMKGEGKYVKNKDGGIEVLDGTSPTGNKKYIPLETYKQRTQTRQNTAKNTVKKELDIIRGALRANRQTELNQADRKIAPIGLY